MVAMGQQMVGHVQGIIILAKSRSHVEVAPSYIDKLFLFHDPDAPCMEYVPAFTPKMAQIFHTWSILVIGFLADLMIVGRDRQHQPVQTWFPAISFNVLQPNPWDEKGIEDHLDFQHPPCHFYSRSVISE